MDIVCSVLNINNNLTVKKAFHISINNQLLTVLIKKLQHSCRFVS